MPTFTSNFNFNKPLVNDPIDEDLWGGQLNDNWDSIDSLLDAFIPIGTKLGYTGTTAPNSRWLLAHGQEISRTTYAAYFALVGTAYGIGDSSTTFNMPDYRGRVAVGLDNLGGTPANRITDANADSLNNTGFGDETDQGTNADTGGHALIEDELPNHFHNNGLVNDNANIYVYGSTSDDTPGLATRSVQEETTGENTQGLTSSVGGDQPHSHAGSVWTGTTGANAQPSIAEAVIIRVL